MTEAASNYINVRMRHGDGIRKIKYGRGGDREEQMAGREDEQEGGKEDGKLGMCSQITYG